MAVQDCWRDQFSNNSINENFLEVSVVELSLYFVVRAAHELILQVLSAIAL